MASENPRLTWIETAAAALLDAVPFSYALTSAKDGKPLLSLPINSISEIARFIAIAGSLASIDITSIIIGSLALVAEAPLVIAVIIAYNLAAKYKILGEIVRHDIHAEL